jgi:hypothetical protein
MPDEFPITYRCNWCRITFTPKSKRSRSKPVWKGQYIACSPECQKKLSSVFQSKEWQKLSERERMIHGGKYGLRDWYDKMEAERVAKVTKYLQANKRSQMAKVKRFIPKNAETILKAHSEVLANDLDSLSLGFIENIMGKKPPT